MRARVEPILEPGISEGVRNLLSPGSVSAIFVFPAKASQSDVVLGGRFEEADLGGGHAEKARALVVFWADVAVRYVQVDARFRLCYPPDTGIARGRVLEILDTD
jgi:hypothetical protein